MKKFDVIVPTALAIIAAAATFRIAAIDGPLGDTAYTVDAAPTPYSEAHARVQSRPGPTEELPPTF